MSRIPLERRTPVNAIEFQTRTSPPDVAGAGTVVQYFDGTNLQTSVNGSAYAILSAFQGYYTVAMTSANITPSGGNELSSFFVITGTGAHNLVLPLTPGKIIAVFNNTSGNVTVIGATGTGITIATGKTAIVTNDGTNFLRITADT